jgi:hypothetical protein
VEAAVWPILAFLPSDFIVFMALAPVLVIGDFAFGGGMVGLLARPLGLS